MDIAGAIALKKICDNHPIDIIHLHDSHAHNIYTLAYLTMGIRLPAILHRRVDFETGNNPLSRFKYNLNGIRKIICVSEKVKSVLQSEVHGSAKMIVIHSGIHANYYSAADGPALQIRKQYQLPENTVLIGNVAALAEHKDHITFLHTAQLILQRMPLARFVIAGSGDQEKVIRSKIRTLGLEGKVFLYGQCPYIPSLLRELDLFLFTSKEEGLGTAILEAMAAGVPVVSTNAGGIPEIIHHRENGMIARVKDAEKLAEYALEVINNGELKNTLIENGKETAAQFSCTSTANAVFSIYREIIPVEQA